MVWIQWAKYQSIYILIRQIFFLGPDRLFTFDYVYPWNCSQEDIFQSSFQPFLPTLLDGYNVSGKRLNQTPPLHPNTWFIYNVGELFITRLLYFNCEHVLIVNIEKQRRNKFYGFYEKNSRIFKILNFFYKNKKLLNTIFFKIFIIRKPSLWSRDVPQKNWARSVQPFWRLLDTNRQKTDKQTDRQAKFIYRLINY